MDSHSRSASPREPMRPQHRPPSPPASPAAFENRGYQHDEDPNHNDSFNSNAPQQNGQNGQNGHRPNGDTKLEAVNLELINLTPKSGTKRKDVEVDMNATNPYDEYFVPVNEHRKFMRGEKLYVTADKRGEKGSCKRPLCWTMLVLLVAAVVALIVLAATGVLFASSPTTVEQYNTSSISSARAFGGVVRQPVHDHSQHEHDHSQHEHDHSQHEHDHSQHEPEPEPEPASTQPPLKHGPETQNDEASVTVSDDGDMSVFVPRTVEGELTIDNEELTSELEDTDSNEYKEFAISFTDGLKRALFNRTVLENGNNDIHVQIIDLKKGSVVVTYRIHWKPRSNLGKTTDPLNSKSLQIMLEKYLKQNNRMINIYHIAEQKKLLTKPVLDVCQMDNNLCEHGCEFDESTLDFTCTCPHGQILEISNPKRCMSILDNTYPIDPVEVMKERDYTVLTMDTNPTTIKSEPKDEQPTAIVQEDNYDWKKTNHPDPEPITESEADFTFSHIFGNMNEQYPVTTVPAPKSSDQPEPTPESGPVTTVEPSPEPEPSLASEPVSSEHSESSLEVIPSPTAEPTIELTTEPEPVPETKVEPEPYSEPPAEPKPKLEPTAETKFELEPTAEPKFEPEPTAEPKVEPEPTAEPKSEPEPTVEFKLEQEPIVEIKTESEKTVEINPVTEPTLETEYEPEPTVEPKSEPEPISEPQAKAESTTPKTPGEQKTMDIISHERHVIEYVPDTEQRSAEIEENTEPQTSNSEKFDHVPEQNEEKVNENENPQLVFTNGEDLDLKMHDEIDTTTEKPSIVETTQAMQDESQDIFSMLAQSKENDSEPAFVTPESTENTTNTEWLENTTTKQENNDYNESESRGFKSIDTFEEDITTAKSYIKKEQTGLTEMEKEDEAHSESVIHHEPSSGEMLNNENTTGANNKENSDNLYANEPAVNGDRPFTEAPVHEYSISQQQENEEEHLMNALVTKKQENVEVTTEGKIDEGMDITFDAINLLYNRSSKSIENQNKLVTTVNKLDIIEPYENVATTTESEWLSEPVAEVTFEDAINTMNRDVTTESLASQVEAVMKTGIPKDDFEPDYLSSNNNKMQEPDEPMYGMTHDYDSEDSRVKRVQENTLSTNNTSKVVANSTDMQVFETRKEPPVSVESTTVVQNIYNSTTTEQPNSTTTKLSSTESFVVQPAPVWEDADQDLRVKELDRTIKIEDPKRISPVFTTGEIIAPTNSTSNSSAVVSETTGVTGLPDNENRTRNSTQLNNLNVTIYEISSHNNSHSDRKVHEQSDEYEDEQDTEMMNPFLPEVENNKVLVKKLQEGHDIEPIVTHNETHSENNEDNKSVTESISAGINSSPETVKITEVSATTASVAADTDTTFYDLLRNNFENKRTDLRNPVILEDSKQEEIASSVPTFLLDTDDLETPTRRSTMTENSLENSAVNSPQSDEDNNDSEYLSVVPIEEERADENGVLYKSSVRKNIQELNDISDSPKKSDRRTIDLSKFDSVIINEA